jgi:hypothetical protein
VIDSLDAMDVVHEGLLEHLLAKELAKASFASRSEAGRYAANVRWQGQGKVFDASSDATNFSLLDRDKSKFDLSRTVSQAFKERISREISPEDHADLLYLLDREPFSMSREKMVEEIRNGTYNDNFLDIFDHNYTGKDDGGTVLSVTSMALQEAVRRKFNPPNAKPVLEKANSDYLEKVNNPTLKKVADILVDEVYKDTQNYLAEKGVKSVVVFRGTKNDELAAQAGSKNVTVRLRPFASFSSDETTAGVFAQKNDWMGRKAKGVILKATVDAKNIFSIGRRNFGMAEENELLVLGGEILLDIKKYKESKRFPD